MRANYPFAGVLEYAGPPDIESVLAWAKAVDAWDGSDKVPVGWEVGKRDETADPGAKAPGSSKHSKPNGNAKRAAAENMKKEKDEV